MSEAQKIDVQALQFDTIFRNRFGVHPQALGLTTSGYCASAHGYTVVSALLTGLGSPGIAPSTRRGDDLLAIKDAYKQNRASLASMDRKG